MAEQTLEHGSVSAGLQYLVSEHILPAGLPVESYSRNTYSFRGGDDDNGADDLPECHEVIATKSCVIWSQGQLIRNVYRFDREGEEVVQALLTRFPSDARRGAYRDGQDRDRDRACIRPRAALALVAFLQSKAHVYFSHGSHYIVELPIEVERALPAPCGVIIQRRASVWSSMCSTPAAPVAPPNSFLSPSLRTSSTHLLSPTAKRSFPGIQPPRLSPLGSNNRLEALFDDAFGSPAHKAEENLAPLYSLSNPLAELGVVSYSLQHHKPRLSNRAEVDLAVDFEPLDAGELLLYVSSQDELPNEPCTDRGHLTLVVTVNYDIQTLTTWHAWQVDEQSLASLMHRRTAHKSAKARRRSSFLSAGMGTGTTTPAARQREGTRESFAAIGPARVVAETGAPVTSAPSSRKPTRQEEDDAMASQMDPDYQPTVSQQSARETRRVSSLTAEARTAQAPSAASFGTTNVGRRNTSFGGANERRSFGYRKSRGSTPGSVFSRSLGPDDDLMEIDSSLDSTGAETVESIVRHIRATFDAAGAESLFGSADGGLKTDLIVRKLHSLSLGTITPSPTSSLGDLRVFTLANKYPRSDTDDQRLNVYIHNGDTKSLTCLNLLVKHRPLWPAATTSPVVSIPLVIGESKLPSCRSVTKLREGGQEVICLDDCDLIVSVNNPTPCTLFTDISARVPSKPSPLSKLKLSSEDAAVDRLLTVLRFALPSRPSHWADWIWFAARARLSQHSDMLEGTALDLDWVAFASTLFCFVIASMDKVNRAEFQSASNVGQDLGKSNDNFLRRQQHLRELSGQTTWHTLLKQHEPSDNASTSTVTEGTDIKDNFVHIAVALAGQLLKSAPRELFTDLATTLPADIAKLMLSLHVCREERKLYAPSGGEKCSTALSVLVVQIAKCLGLPGWSNAHGTYYMWEGASAQRWQYIQVTTQLARVQLPLMEEPVGIFAWFENAVQYGWSERYPTVDVIVAMGDNSKQTLRYQEACRQMTPRVTALSHLVESTSGFKADPITTVELICRFGFTLDMIEVLPSAIAAPLQEAITACEKAPPSTWPPEMLNLVGRNDLDLHTRSLNSASSATSGIVAPTSRDTQSICGASDQNAPAAKSREADRHAVSQLLFNEDRRLIEATNLLHFNSPQIAECPKQPEWSDAFHLEQQRKVMQWVTIRMISLPIGDAMLHFDSQKPLLTDRFQLAGFNNLCLMQPMGHTLTIDRSGLTEERVNWAYFHAGVSAGLRISRDTKGIDTSWIAYNKPGDLTNRHAGLLLALGLNGHLRNVAKWLSFKYLTPKHTMTSVGLLLGLSASYMGTMDGLVTRMLSVHITRMLPPGAAELNVSPITQTAGLMGIGLLYYNTHHRRMSEIMMSEIEHMELEDPDSGPDPLRDESYRLAAGFALGFINLGKGRDLRGLHGMRLPERLLAVAVGPRPVNAVHVFDRATAGAVVAVAFVYMKSGDKAIAQKIDIPDTEAQFDHVRPDILMLRAMSKHIILWDGVDLHHAHRDGSGWIQANLPACYNSRFQLIHTEGGQRGLRSSDIPFFNIVTGLAWALSLKYAGSNDTEARDEILKVLDHFHEIQSGSGYASTRVSNYDTKLTRSTLRRCIDALAVFAATVMAGTGDLQTFRYLRRLHGRTDADTPYGSHLAAHVAIGVLYLGGGTYTFGTSNLAIASLICAFYPLYPTDVHDNHVHLQAFRHLWVFAAEARCLVVEDADTQRPISIPMVITMKDGSSRPTIAPSLLPELSTIARLHTDDPAYWRVTLDFADNPHHMASFKEKRRIFVRRCAAAEANSSIFFATLSALHEVPSSDSMDSLQKIWHSVFRLAVFKGLDKADLELIFPPDPHNSIYTAARETMIDERLALERSLHSDDRDALWNLRTLFAWAEKASQSKRGKLKWIGQEIIETLKAEIEERRRGAEARMNAL